MAAKCPECRLLQEYCVCSLLPRVKTRTSWIVLRHKSEKKKVSNTGRLLLSMVEGARIVSHGEEGSPIGVADVAGEGDRTAVLFPGPGSTPLAPDPDLPGLPRGGFRNLVLLDGSWVQARRMIRRIPGLCDLPRLSLPRNRPATWDVRMPPAEGYFCTLEAAIIALEVLGEIETASTLARIMDVVRRRLLFARGRIPPGELTPAEIKG